MLEKVWRKNQGLFRSIVRTVLFDLSSTDDVLQEAFARLLQCKKSFSSEREAFQYLRRVVFSTTIDHYRRMTRQELLLKNPYLTSREQPDPLNLLIREEEEELQTSLVGEICKVVRQLPREQREAIELMFGHPHKRLKEMCKQKGIPYSTLRSRMIAAIDQIRTQLRAKGIYRDAHEEETMRTAQHYKVKS